MIALGIFGYLCIGWLISCFWERMVKGKTTSVFLDVTLWPVIAIAIICLYSSLKIEQARKFIRGFD